MDIKLSPMQQKLHDLFPAEGDIPEDCRVLAPLHQRSILLNGEMQIWKGETRAVFSPVHVRAADGSLTPVELGSFPVTGTAEETIEWSNHATRLRSCRSQASEPFSPLISSV